KRGGVSMWNLATTMLSRKAHREHSTEIRIEHRVGVGSGNEHRKAYTIDNNSCEIRGTGSKTSPLRKAMRCHSTFPSLCRGKGGKWVPQIGQMIETVTA
ncbi:hypothetical protein U1Q18_050121, partial [Sarracenia purpurea var. burkii]